MRIPFIIEPGYGSSAIWTPAIRSGIESELSRKKYDSLFIEYDSIDYDELNSCFDGSEQKLAVMIGTSPSFVLEMIDSLAKHGIGVLLVSYQPPENAPVRGVVRTDYVAGVDILLRHLFACGCRRPALYAGFTNSSPDIIKRRAYFEYSALDGFEPITIDNDGGLVSCFEKLSSRLDDIDSLVCVNDIAAVSAVNRLGELGIRVPDDVQVVSFGGSEVSRLYSPSITVLEMPNFELGRQVVNSFSYLMRSSGEVSLSVRVAGDLVVRETTKPTAPMPPRRRLRTTGNSSFYDDNEVKDIERLELLLSVCDQLDRRIIWQMLSGSTTERAAEVLSLSPETIRYRMRRIVQSAGFNSRGEILEFIAENRFGSIFVNNL